MQKLQTAARSRSTIAQRNMLREIRDEGAVTHAGRARTKSGKALRYDRFEVLRDAGWIEIQHADGFSTWWEISPDGAWMLGLYKD